MLSESERITERESEYIRLIAPFELSAAQKVDVQIILSGSGSVDVDGATLKTMPLPMPTIC